MTRGDERGCVSVVSDRHGRRTVGRTGEEETQVESRKMTTDMETVTGRGPDTSL